MLRGGLSVAFHGPGSSATFSLSLGQAGGCSSRWGYRERIMDRRTPVAEAVGAGGCW